MCSVLLTLLQQHEGDAHPNSVGIYTSRSNPSEWPSEGVREVIQSQPMGVELLIWLHQVSSK